MSKSFSDLLAEIANNYAPLPIEELQQLSDLSDDSTNTLTALWPKIDVHRRRELVRRLADICQVNFAVDFSTIGLLGIKDPDDLVRLAAIDTFWDSEDPALIVPLLQLMESDTDLRVRASAARALGQFVLLGELDRLPQKLFQQVIQALLTTIYGVDSGTLVHCRALESIAAAGLVEIPNLIQDAYQSDLDEFQISAVAAMGRTADDAWEPLILKELDNLNPSMRYQAVKSAGQLELSAAVAQLIDLLDDPDPEVMRASIQSLGNIGGQKARQALEPLLVDEELELLVFEAIEMIDLGEGVPPGGFYDWTDGT